MRESETVTLKLYPSRLLPDEIYYVKFKPMRYGAGSIIPYQLFSREEAIKCMEKYLRDTRKHYGAPRVYQDGRTLTFVWIPDVAVRGSPKKRRVNAEFGKL